GADANGAVFGGELVGIREEVYKHLGETGAVAFNIGKLLWKGHFQSLAAQGQEGSDQGAGILHDLGQVDTLVADVELSGFDADTLEEVVDQAGEAQCAALE